MCNKHLVLFSLFIFSLLFLNACARVQNDGVLLSEQVSEKETESQKREEAKESKKAKDAKKIKTLKTLKKIKTIYSKNPPILMNLLSKILNCFLHTRAMIRINKNLQRKRMMRSFC